MDLSKHPKLVQDVMHIYQVSGFKHGNNIDLW